MQLTRHASLVVLAVAMSGALLTGCGLTKTTTPAAQPATGGAPAAEQKVGDTTKVGTVSESSGRFYLNVTGQPPQEIDSYSVDLSGYVGQSVTVTGQFSGNTLFVGSIK